LHPCKERRSERIPSLAPVFEALKRMRDPRSRKACRTRALVLVKVASLARAIDLSYWRFDSLKFDTDGFTVTAARTKGRPEERSFRVYRFLDQPELCPVTALEEYVNVMSTFDRCEFVWRAVKSPFRVITADRISSSVNDFLKSVSGDFKSHLLRAASASIAAAGGVSLDSIQVAGGWRSAATMLQYYVRRPDAEEQVQQAVFAGVLGTWLG